MKRQWGHWVVLGGLLSVTAYAVAEEITLTTYYPSPRGVYNELRTSGDVHIGDLLTPTARLHVVQPDANIAPAFRVDDTVGDTTPFLIDATGNVGIGDATPLALLTVGDGDLFRVQTTGQVLGIAGTAAAPTYSFTGDPDTGVFSPGPNLLSFATTGIEHMRMGTGLLPGGQALVVIASPPRLPANARLTVWGEGIMGIYADSATGAGLEGHSNIFGVVGTSSVNSSRGILGTAANIGVVGTGATGIQATGTTWAGDFIGNVRISGNLSLPPGRNLTVGGNTTIGGNLSVTGNGNFGGTVFAASDARFKTNVMPLAGVLDRLEQVHGVSFEWNDLYRSLGYQPDGTKQIGVIAQELETVFPELVSSSGSEGYRAVDYLKLNAVLLEAIKELKTEHDALEQRVIELEAQRSEHAGVEGRRER